MIRELLHILFYPKAYRELTEAMDQATRRNIAKAFQSEVLILNKLVVVVAKGKAFDQKETDTIVRCKEEILYYMTRFFRHSDHLTYIQEIVIPILDKFVIKRAMGKPTDLSELTYSMHYLVNLADLMRSGHLKANVS